MRVLGLALLLAVTIGLPATWRTAEAQSGDFYAGERWTGWAEYDEDGRFSFCLVGAEYDDGIALRIGLDPTFNLFVALESPAWRLVSESRFPVRLVVDDRWSADTTASAVGGRDVMIIVGEDWNGIEALRRGRVLHVEAQRETFSFALIGTAVALKAAARCVLDRSGQSGTSDPFSLDDAGLPDDDDPFGTGKSNPPKGGQGAASLEEPRTDIRGAIASLLTAAGLQDVHMLSDSDRVDVFPYSEEAWEFAGGYGTFTMYEADGRSPEEHVADALASLQRDCRGGFASGILPDPSSTLERYYASCDDDQEINSYVLRGVVVMGTHRVGVIEHFGYPGQAGDVSDVDDRVVTILAAYE